MADPDNDNLTFDSIRQALREDPTRAALWLRLGEHLASVRQLDDALGAYLTASQVDPERAFAWYRIAQAQRDLNHLDEAQQSIVRAKALAPADSEIFALEGDILIRRGDYSRAEVALRCAVKLQPASSAIMDQLGVLLATQHRAQEALAVFDQAIQQDAQAWKPRFNKGILLRDALKYPRDAMALFEQVLAINPSYTIAWLEWGVCLSRLHRYREALEKYERYEKIAEPTARLCLHQGWALRGLRQYGEALSRLDQAVALDPESADVWEQRGWVLLRLHRYQETLGSMNRAIALDPEFANAWQGRLTALFRLHRFRECWRDLRYALGLRLKHSTHN